MTFRPSAPNKKRRWLALLATVVVGGALLAAPVFAVSTTDIPNSAFIEDDAGQDDEPGQKDLTAQGQVRNGTFFTGWKWDDISWPGKNSGDGCNLFTIDAPDANADYVVCATIGTVAGVLTLQTVTVYSCSDGRTDRCTNPDVVEVFRQDAGDYCAISNSAPSQFVGDDDLDTVIVCDITAISTAAGVDLLENADLINTCSYPSREPNSDPSDCVFDVPNQDVTISTVSDGTIDWTATLFDTATLSVPGATGSVTFELYDAAGCAAADLIWTSPADSTPNADGKFESGTTGGTPSLGNVITDENVNADGKYYWIARYTATGDFNSDASACGEVTTIVATVTGSSGS